MYFTCNKFYRAKELVHGDRNIFIKKYDEDAFYTTDLNDVFRCRICATNLLSSNPSPPQFKCDEITEPLVLFCGQAAGCLSGKKKTELLLDIFIHLNSQSDMNVLLTGSFQRRAAIQISGTLDPFLLSLFLAKGEQTKAIQRVHDK